MSLIHETPKDEFIFVTMKCEIDGVKDFISRIYSGGVLRYHGSDNILTVYPTGVMELSPQGVSTFCCSANMQEEINEMVGGIDSFHYWTEQSQYLYVFTGKTWRDLLDGGKQLDAINNSAFYPFFKEFRDEFKWAMSDGRLVNLAPDRSFMHWTDPRLGGIRR